MTSNNERALKELMSCAKVPFFGIKEDQTWVDINRLSPESFATIRRALKPDADLERVRVLLEDIASGEMGINVSIRHAKKALLILAGRGR